MGRIGKTNCLRVCGNIRVELYDSRLGVTDAKPVFFLGARKKCRDVNFFEREVK